MSTGTDNDRWVRLLGSASAPGWEVAITEGDGWTHTRLFTTGLAQGEDRKLETGEWEYVVVPLSGALDVTVIEADGTSHQAHLAGRDSVFDGPCDVVYVPRGARLTVSASTPTGTDSRAPVRVALAGAWATKADSPKPYRQIAAAEIPVELRGAGVASREVRGFGMKDTLDADSILTCEVITPAGNWSSWPPHKHDTEVPGSETALEEIYYFETASTDPQGEDPFGYQRVYSADEARPVDVLAEVRTGDVVLVPHGWHGPAMAAPDAHLYYLNVMAGPGPQRAWMICNDPTHAWVTGQWPALDVDPRLPMGGIR